MDRVFCNDDLKCKRCKLIDELRNVSLQYANYEEKSIWRYAHQHFIEDDIAQRAIDTFKNRKYQFTLVLEELAEASALCCHAVINAQVEQDARNREYELAAQQPYDGLAAIVYYSQPSTQEDVIAIICKRNATYAQGQWIDDDGNILYGVTSWSLE